ncbi:MAG: SRPBCC family protein [Candidatus Ranarchaeia archaeon]
MSYPKIPPKKSPDDVLISREIDINAPIEVVFEVLANPELFVDLEPIVESVTITSEIKKGKGVITHWEFHDPVTKEKFSTDEETIHFEPPYQIAYTTFGGSGAQGYTGVHNLSVNPDGSTHDEFNEVFHFKADPEAYAKVIEKMLANVKIASERRVKK